MRESVLGRFDGMAAATPRLLDELNETVLRSRPGGFFYLLLWALCGWVARLWEHAPGMYFGVAGLFLCMALVRLRNPVLPPGASIDVVHGRLNAIWVVLLLTTLSWALASTWLLLWSPSDDVDTLTAVSTYAFAIASAHTFCMRLNRAFMAVALVSLPTLLVLAATHSRIPVVAIGLLCLVYAGLVAKRGHVEYQKRMDLEDELRRQRDLYELQSRRDALTGLPNRRRFSAVLKAWVAGVGKRGEPLSLLVLDLDHFKTINDVHGHASGDECLRAFAWVLEQTFDGPDMLPARLGGEEFAVLLRDCRLETAAEKAESVRAGLERHPLVLPDGMSMEVRVSIGVAVLEPAHAADAELLMKAADAALYRAKESGRNAVCLARSA